MSCDLAWKVGGVTVRLLLLGVIVSACYGQKADPNGWSGARWGMTEREVLAAFPGEAKQLKGSISDRRFGNQTAAVRTEGAHVGGIALQANFFFDDTGGLVKVLLRRPESTSSPFVGEWFKTLATSMDLDYGEPTVRGSDAEGDHLVSGWIFPQTVVELTLLDAVSLRMSMLAVTFEKRTGQTPDALMRGLQPVHGKLFPRFIFSMTKPKASKDLTVDDDEITATFAVRDSEISVGLLNKTETPIKIDWDQVSFVETDGTASKVIHSGVRLMERDRPQVPTTVPPGAKVTEAITPSNRVRYDKGWQISPLLPKRGTPANAVCGGHFQVFMPLIVGPKTENRAFAFSINCD